MNNQLNQEWWQTDYPLNLRPGEWHVGMMWMDSHRRSGLKWYDTNGFCAGRVRRGKYLWKMMRALQRRRSIVFFWMKVAFEGGCATNGRMRKRHRSEYEAETV